MFNPFDFLKPKAKPTVIAPVLFHKEANGLPQHGVLCATHAQLKITKSDGVRFSFQDIEPPLLTAEVLTHITDQAERKGYVVHSLSSYAGVVNLIPAPVLQPRSASSKPVLHEGPRAGESRGVATTPRRAAGARAQGQGHAA